MDRGRVRAIMLARDLTLTREERHELAGMLRDGDPFSWTHLTDEEVVRLTLWLDGARLVRDLMRLRG